MHGLNRCVLMQMRSSCIWFALVAAVEPERAFRGAGAGPNMSFGAGDVCLASGSGYFLKIPKRWMRNATQGSCSQINV